LYAFTKKAEIAANNSSNLVVKTGDNDSWPMLGKASAFGGKVVKFSRFTET